MKVLSDLNRRLALNLSVIEVKEIKDRIVITGFRVNYLQKAIKDIWDSKRLNNIFINFSDTHIEFHSFFAMEMLYILNKIKNDNEFSIAGRISEKIIELLLERTWIVSSKQEVHNKLDSKQLKLFKKEPLESQLEFFNDYNRLTQQYLLNGFMLAAPPGSGKTLSSLMLAAQLKAACVVIVCPKNAIDKPWSTTLETELTEKVTYWKSNSDIKATIGKNYYICHYEYLDKFITEVNLPPNTFIILDESHNFNEIRSNRTLLFIELCKKTKTKNILWMSGTPLKALGSEMIPFLFTIDPLFNKVVAENFKSIFGSSQTYAADILAHRLGLSSYKVDKKTVVTQEKIETTVKINFPGADKYTLPQIKEQLISFVMERTKYYEKRKKEDKAIFDECIELYRKNITTAREEKELNHYLKLVTVISKTKDFREHRNTIIYLNDFEKKVIYPNLPDTHKKQFHEVKSIIKYVHLKIQGEALGRIVGKMRSECNVELAKFIDLSGYIEKAEKKTLIFTSFIDVLIALDKKLTSQSFTPLLVYGETNKYLTTIINHFEKDSGLNPLIATYQSLSTAVPIVVANTVILMNQPFRSYEREQAISRVHRLGQDTTVRVINVLLDTGDIENISTRSMDIMKWSKQQVDILLGIKEGKDEIELDDTISLESFYNENFYTTNSIFLNSSDW